MRRWLVQALRRIKHAVSPPEIPNLMGDRELEDAWVAAKLPRTPGLVLDFGCGRSNLSLTALQLGHSVVRVDLQEPELWYRLPPNEFIKGDILKIDFGGRLFDAIINCSTIEHVGLAGRYGSPDMPDGDLQAMARLRDLLAPRGVMIMTLPAGRDAVFAPLHRIYGTERLPRLLEGYKVLEECFWIKREANRWSTVGREAALAEPGSGRYYGLGLFLLGLPEKTG